MGIFIKLLANAKHKAQGAKENEKENKQRSRI